MEKIFVKPASAAVKVRDPQSKKNLAAEGELKPDTTYWRRRINDGDVKLTDAPKAAPGASAPVKN